MPTPFLENTPREIRDIIYRYVLSSPTGNVALLETSEILGIPSCESLSAASNFLIVSSPSSETDDPSSLVIISLTLLRTCKQIHDECKNLFWKWNVLSIGEPKTRSFSRLMRPYLLQPSGQIHSIELDVNKGTLLRVDDIRFTLNMLVHWSRVGCLKNISINWNPIFPKDTVASGGGDISGLLHSEQWFGFSIYSRVVIKTKFSKIAGRTSEYNYLFRSLFPQVLHEVFGGELLLDGFLCFKNHQQLVKSFNDGPDNEIIPNLSII